MSPSTTNNITPPPPPQPSNEQTLSRIIINHFDSYQRKQSDRKSNRNNVDNDVHTHTALLRKDIFNFIQSTSVSKGKNDHKSKTKVDLSSLCDQLSQLSILDDGRVEVTNVIICCVDAVIANIASSQGSTKDFSESADRIFEFASALSVEVGHGYATEKLVSRAVQYSKSELDFVRTKGCQLMGYCLKYSFEGSRGSGSSPSKGSGQQRDSKRKFHVGVEEWMLTTSKQIRDALLTRIHDKSQAVRNSAIQSCGYFFPCTIYFEKMLEDVVDSLVWSMSHMSSFGNRLESIRSAPANEKTLPHIIERLRDVKDKVRVCALEVLREKFDVKDLSEEQRCDVVRYGLTERCQATSSGTLKLICCGWMKSVKYDPIALLRMLDPSTNEKLCENVIRALITIVSSPEDDIYSSLALLSDPEIRAFKESMLVLPHKNTLSKQNNEDESTIIFDAATALYIRLRCLTIPSSSKQTPYDILSPTIPDATSLCDLLKRHLSRYISSVSNREKDFVTSNSVVEFDEDAARFEDEECFTYLQLLKLSQYIGLEEEGSRRRFIECMKEMMNEDDMPHDMIEGCVKAMASVNENDERGFLDVMETVFDSVSINTNSGNEDLPVRYAREMRALSLLSTALEYLSRKYANDLIFEKFGDFIITTVTSPNPHVRENAIKCLGKLGLLLKEATLKNEFLPLLLKVATNEKEADDVKSQAIMAICDVSLFFPLIETTNHNNDVPTNTESSLPNILYDLIQCEFLSQAEDMVPDDNVTNGGTLVIVAEACVKLLFAGKINDPNTLAQLLKLYFDLDNSISIENSDDAEEASEVGSPIRLQQLLCLFFPAYMVKRPEGKQALLAAIPLVLDLLLAVKDKSSNKRKSTRMIVKILNYIFSLIENAEEHQRRLQEEQQKQPNEEKAANDNSHGKEATDPVESSCKVVIMIAICQFIQDNLPDISVVHLRALCKIVGGFDLTTSNVNNTSSQVTELIAIVDQLEEFVEDKTSLKALEPLIDAITDRREDADGDDEGSNSLVVELDKTVLDDDEIDESTTVEEDHNNYGSSPEKENIKQDDAKNEKKNRKGLRRSSRLSGGSSTGLSEHN